METENKRELMGDDGLENPEIAAMEEITIEELAVDGICGIY